MVRTMMEFHIGKPCIAVLVPGDRRIVFLFRRLDETVRRGNAIDVDPSSQAVNTLAVSEVRAAELEISLRRGERDLTAFGDALRGDDKPVRYDRGGATKGGAGE